MSSRDCCEGEPFRGDPNGLHTFDCPAYQAFCDRLAAEHRAHPLIKVRPAPPVDFDLPGAESTSAALRRVEQERDESRDEARRLRHQLGFADSRIRQVERERDSLARRCAVRFEETAAARAELASARTELERLRAACDPYPNPPCGKRTGNASNRCLRAPGHDGWCDDDPPVLPYREIERLRTELGEARSENAALRQESQALQALLQSPPTTAINRSEGAPPA